jgi:hypothetical protein
MDDDAETGIKIYLREIMQTPLLAAQQEIELERVRSMRIKADLYSCRLFEYREPKTRSTRMRPSPIHNL